jgi:hypothetical protein
MMLIDGSPTTGTFVSGVMGQVVNANHVDGGVHQHLYGRRAVTASLDTTVIEDLRRIFVHPPNWEDLVTRLKESRVMALVAEPGSGRRITAANLLADIGVPVRELLLPDRDELDRYFTAEPNIGYVLTVPAEVTSSPVITQLAQYIGEVMEKQSFVVIIATKSTEHALEEYRAVDVVEVRPPDCRDLFRKVLARRQPLPVVDEWTAAPQIGERLRGSRPTDAYRLACLVDEVLDQNHGGDPLAEVIDAYGDWREQLRSWDQETNELDDAPDRRAMLLAVAAFETAPPEVVLDAARKLLSVASLERPKGSGLAGPGVAEKLGQVKAVVNAEGGVTFNRADFGRAVLDHTWKDRPHLRETLSRWLTEVYADVPVPYKDRAGEVLLALAERRGSADEILRLAATWIHRGREQQASRILGEAVLSPTIGAPVRRKLYEWAKNSGTDLQYHLLVASVCSGELARFHPGIALTRLRHLARRETPQVRDAVVGVVRDLASDGRVGFQLEREIAGWIGDGDPTRALTGRRCFLALADLAGPDGVPLLLDRACEKEAIDLLAGCWSASFRDAETKTDAKNIAASWFETAYRDLSRRETIAAVLTRTCLNSVDIANLTWAVVEWWKRDGDVVPTGVSGFPLELIKRFVDNDGLVTGPVEERADDVEAGDVDDLA